MEWNEDTIARLRTLWADGHSTAEIGRRIAVSKNAVVGKAHRLGLPPRPSPIRRDGIAAAPRPQAPRRAVGPTLPPLSAVASAPPVERADAPPARPAAVSQAEAGVAAVAVPARAAVAVPIAASVAAASVAAPAVRAVASPRTGRLVACCWPIGEPGTKAFRFCDMDAVTGKPYCAEHVQVAYVKVRDRREEAA